MNRFLAASAILLLITGVFAYMQVDSHSDNEDPEPAIELAFNSSCSGLLVSASADGVPLEGASVTVRRLTDASLIAWGETDQSGALPLDVCGERVDVKATKSGYRKSDLQTLQLSECVACPECVSDSECQPTQSCSAGACVPVRCDCGTVIDHACSPFECCSQSDCRAGYSCDSNKCAPLPEAQPDGRCLSDDACLGNESCVQGSCEAVPCSCGHVENHVCSTYQCCSDDDCGQASRCIDNACTEPADESSDEQPAGGQPTSPFDMAVQIFLALMLLLLLFLGYRAFFVK